MSVYIYIHMKLYIRTRTYIHEQHIYIHTYTRIYTRIHTHIHTQTHTHTKRILVGHLLHIIRPSRRIRSIISRGGSVSPLRGLNTALCVCMCVCACECVGYVCVCQWWWFGMCTARAECVHVCVRVRVCVCVCICIHGKSVWAQRTWVPFAAAYASVEFHNFKTQCDKFVCVKEPHDYRALLQTWQVTGQISFVKELSQSGLVCKRALIFFCVCVCVRVCARASTVSTFMHNKYRYTSGVRRNIV